MKMYYYVYVDNEKFSWNSNKYVINPYHIPQISCDQICPQPAKNEV